jgi:hypothetical protein
MKAPFNSILAAVGAGFVFAVAAASAAPALAGGMGGNNNCGCQQPPPAQHHGPQPPNVNVHVGVNVNTSVNVNAQVKGQAGAATTVFSGGGNSSYLAPGPTGLIQGLDVQGGEIQRTAYEAERTKIKKVIIEVVCIDDKEVPHPGSQVTPDRDIDDAYDGELYRCIAGTHLRATIADYTGAVAFDHGWTMDCDKGQALYHAPGGHVECRMQKPARDCNERSLLRRFGAGIKILTMITTERYTAYREDSVQGATASSMTIDGGVGGVMY